MKNKTKTKWRVQWSMEAVIWQQEKPKKPNQKLPVASSLIGQTNIIWASSSTSGRPTRMIHVFLGDRQNPISYFDFLIHLLARTATALQSTDGRVRFPFLSSFSWWVSVGCTRAAVGPVLTKAKEKAKHEPITRLWIVGKKRKLLSRCAERLNEEHNPMLLCIFIWKKHGGGDHVATHPKVSWLVT